METRRLVLREGEGLGCELLGIVRDHHDSMPGEGRDRPGWDRITVRLRTGEVVTTDVWTDGSQDLRAVSSAIDLYESGDLVRWRCAAPAPALHTDEPANDGPLRSTG